MELYAVDQISISSVRADSLKPGEKFIVSKSLGEELLKKWPNSVSQTPPKQKTRPVSVKSVLDQLTLDVAAAEKVAEEKKKAFEQSVADAQADADIKIAAIKDTVVSAQADADTKIGEINASVEAARETLKALEDQIEAQRQAATEENPEGGEDTDKSKQSPQNKMKPAPDNK